MAVINHSNQELEVWRAGVETRMRVSTMNGAAALCLFEQWCEPGQGAPLHHHTVEEVLSVVRGEMEVWLGDNTMVVTADQSVVIPAEVVHGFRNCGLSTLHVMAVLASAHFDAVRHNSGETVIRWSSEVGGGVDR